MDKQIPYIFNYYNYILYIIIILTFNIKKCCVNLFYEYFIGMRNLLLLLNIYFLGCIYHFINFII